jgi:hypothetical protein
LALPSHLARYDALLDLLAEQIAREILAERDSPAADRAEWEHAMMVERAEVESVQDFHKSWQASIRSKSQPP